MLKKVLAAAILVLLVFAVGCKKKGGVPTGDVTLEMWSFTDELEPVLDRFEEQYPNVTMNLTIIPSEDYLQKLRPVLRSGSNAPDLFTAEMADVRVIVESGFYANLDEAPFNADVSDLTEYQVDMGTDSNGNLRAVSWQTTPGGFFYRRSYAKEFLGTDDPAEVGAMIDTQEKFVETARKIKDASGGEVAMIPGINDYNRYPLSAREKPFVDNGKLIIEPVLIEFFDVAKTLNDEDLTGDIGQWSPPWFANMKKDGKVFGYSLPTWGLHYVLKPNAPDSAGDWGLTNGPASYFWGGTWMGVYEKSEQKEAAWAFIEWFTLNEETLTWWAKETGDFVGNEKVVAKIKDDFSEEFLGGQNHYKFFAAEAPKINANNIGPNYQQIQGMYMGAVNNYVEGNMTKDEAIQNFKDDVKSAFPDVQVD